LLPSRALSFAPAACSVSVLVVWRNRGMKKRLIIAALSDMLDNRHLSKRGVTLSAPTSPTPFVSNFSLDVRSGI